jgi:transglutaminase/protease-like cytokinesis protein 3
VAHSWNIIEIADKYYHVDLTWDANCCAEHGEYSYDWFLLDDESILSDHSWDVNSTPAAIDTSLTYYRNNNLFANSEADVIDIFVKGIQSENTIRTKCSENVWSSKPMEEYLSQLLIDTALKYRSKVEISYSWCEKTNCFFAKFV